jgi:hypothetical protein
MAFTGSPTITIRNPNARGLSEGGSILSETYNDLVLSDCNLFEGKWRNVYGWRRPASPIQLDDAGMTHTAYELDYYDIDENNLPGTVATSTGMRSWKCFLAGMIYQVPYPMPGLDIDQSNTAASVIGTTIANRGGFRVRVWGSQVDVILRAHYLTTEPVSGVLVPGNGADAVSQLSFSVGVYDRTAEDNPDDFYLDGNLLFPKRVIGGLTTGLESGDYLMLMGYFRAGTKLNTVDDEWADPDDNRYYFSGIQINEYAPSTWKIDVTRPNGNT